MTRVAGHDLRHTPRGLACSVCDRRWLDMLDQRHRWNVGETDIAHVGALNADEVRQLLAFEVRYNEWLWDAVSGRSSVVDDELAAAEVA